MSDMKVSNDCGLFVQILDELMPTIVGNLGSLKALANCSMICKLIHIKRQPFTPTNSPASFLHDERLVMAVVMGKNVSVPFNLMKNSTHPVLQGIHFPNRRILPSFEDAVPNISGNIIFSETMSLEQAIDVYQKAFKPSENKNNYRDYLLPSILATVSAGNMIPYDESWSRVLHINLHGGVKHNKWSKCFHRVLAESFIKHAEFDHTTGDIHLGSWAVGVNKYIADRGTRREWYVSILKDILDGKELLLEEELCLANDRVLQHYLLTGDLLKTGKFPEMSHVWDHRIMSEHYARCEIKCRMRFAHTSPDNMFSLRHLIEHVLYKCSLRMPGVCNARELRTVRFKTAMRNEHEKSITEMLGCGGKNSPLELRWLAGSMGSQQQEVSIYHNIEVIRSSSKMVTGRRIIDSLLEMMHEFKLALLEVQLDNEDIQVLGRHRVATALQNLELTREQYEAVQLRYFELEELEIEFDDTSDAIFPGLQLELIDNQRFEEGEWCNLFDNEPVHRAELVIVKKIWTQVYNRLWPRFLAKTHDNFHVCAKNARDVASCHLL
jgi:hypothetical protein